MNMPLDAATAGRQIKGSSIISAIKAARIEYILSVPDIVTSHGLLFPIAKDPCARLVASARKMNASALRPGCPTATSAH